MAYEQTERETTGSWPLWCSLFFFDLRFGIFKLFIIVIQQLFRLYSMMPKYSGISVAK